MPMLLYGNGTISGASSFTDPATFQSTLGVVGAINASSTLTTSGSLVASNGIAFPATQNAITNSNTLDDYEEGTWTPSYIGLTSGTATHTGQAGYYIKIGRQVTVWWILRAVRGTCSGSLAISGLPFPAFNGNVEYGYLSKLGSHWGGWLTAPNINYAVNGQSYIQLWDVNTNTLSSTALDTATSCASVSQLTYLSNS